jgi:hypothetical protein
MEDLNGVTRGLESQKGEGEPRLESESSVVGMQYNYEQLETRLTITHRGTGRDLDAATTTDIDVRTNQKKYQCINGRSLMHVL